MVKMTHKVCDKRVTVKIRLGKCLSRPCLKWLKNPEWEPYYIILLSIKNINF